MVFFDASAGPILVRRGATIQAFTRLVGPCVIGEDSIVLGGRVAASSIGEHCRVLGAIGKQLRFGCQRLAPGEAGSAGILTASLDL
jgi:hypothetical protein